MVHQKAILSSAIAAVLLAAIAVQGKIYDRKA